MSASTSASDSIPDGCRPVDATPITIDATALDTTAPSHLRERKATLRNDGFVTAELTAEASFEEDCSLSTQQTVDRIRNLVDAAAFLGADTLTLTVDDVANPSKVEPALNACAERASREGVELSIDGTVSLS